ncbi:hypothetical protein [Rhizobium paknamense]|uniref:Uncharacterized protein n=1 Tax=Rhizobium paknamense TaxID=1206817 RepID=A0ABU0I778_9HYPH|nr:hypothetical protein [Rhizobium paknamense]MDQ0454082.1 hypothetical protein [Rhizobium paknamense]
MSDYPGNGQKVNFDDLDGRSNHAPHGMASVFPESLDQTLKCRAAIARLLHDKVMFMGNPHKGVLPSPLRRRIPRKHNPGIGQDPCITPCKGEDIQTAPTGGNVIIQPALKLAF